MRILVCDDEAERAAQWVAALKSLPPLTSANVAALDQAHAKRAVLALEQRLHSVRERKGEGYGTIQCDFDAADVLIVDYDLLKFSTNGDFLTGDKIAYLARVFSDVQAIVVVNQFGDREFDLSLMRDARSRADVNIGSGYIANPGLWSETFQGYRPWMWPSIPDLVGRFRTRVNELLDGGVLDKPILEHLGFKTDDLALLSTQAVEYLGRSVDEDANEGLDGVTFRHFALSSGALDSKDAKALEQLRDDRKIARVAAASVAKWLERQVLVCQDVLVDWPHLAERVPHLVDPSGKPVLTGAQPVPLLQPPAVYAMVARHGFTASSWLSRPAFWWPRISEDREVRSVKFPEGLDRNAFCEDTSRFARPGDCRDFVAEVGGLFSRRRVSKGADSKSTRYTPSFRLAM